MPDRIIERFLVRLMAGNADDGTACGMVGLAEMRSAVLTAYGNFQRLCPTGSGSDFLRFLRHECLGAPDLPLAPLRPVPSPHSRLCNTPMAVSTISTVVTAGTLVRLLSRTDKLRFSRRGVRFSVSTGAALSYSSHRVTETLIDRLARLPGTERRFRLADGESLGRPYVWFTAKADLDSALNARAVHGRTRADVARDLLGLIHHGPISRETSGPNHLFALHLPSDVAVIATYMRPAAPQAFDNRRFVLRFADVPTTADNWGETLDLDFFATRSAGKPVGARERVLLRLQASLLAKGTEISFDYLGAVTSTRGGVPNRDDDDTFLGLIGRGRDLDVLVKRMCR